MDLRRLAALLVCLMVVDTAFCAYCNSCGAVIPEKSRFCNVCGAAQQLTAPQPSSSSKRPTQVQKKDSRDGDFFARLTAPLEAHEEALKISNLDSVKVLPLIQRTLIPTLEAVQRELKRRNITLTRPQAKILALYGERYSTILKWATTLGSDRDILLLRIEHATALQAALRAVPSEECLTVVKAVEQVYANEEKHFYERRDTNKTNAGFENPGVAYQIPKIAAAGTAAEASQIPFTLLVSNIGRKIGDRMQVRGFTGEMLGTLKFEAEEGGVRRYVGFLPRTTLCSVTPKTITIEYATRSKLSPSWKSEKLKLYILPALPPNSAVAFECESFYGLTPQVSRIRYLQSLGKY